MNIPHDMTDAEYAADPYWKATEDIIYQLAEHHANGLKWPCSECSTKINEMLHEWFPPAHPAPEAATIDAGALQRIEELAGIAIATVVKGPDEDGEHWCGICDAMLEDELSGHKADCASRVLRDIYEIANKSKHASKHAGKQGSDPRIPGLVNGIRSLVMFHTKNGTMHRDCARNFAELVAPYRSYAPSGEVVNEAAAPDSAREGEKP